MNTLRISILGNIRIAHACSTSEVKVTRVVRALLAFLLLNRHHIHSREVLADLFWGNNREENARSCLSTALWRLRRALEPEGTFRGTYLKTASGRIGFNTESDYWLDVEVFEENIGRILRKPFQTMDTDDATQLQNTLKLYTGELLEGFYDEWALRERERLRVQYLKALEHLMDYHGYHKAYESAITRGQEILSLDSLREGIHRKLMRLYAECGQRTEAIRQYRYCRRIIYDELGVDPTEKTHSLYCEIVKLTDSSVPDAAPRQTQSAKTSEETINLEEAFKRLQLAMKDDEQIYNVIMQLSDILEKFVKTRDYHSPK